MSKKVRPPRYKNEPFLRALGKHCQQLRLKKGYTIDRIYREGDQLSTSAIHRLENGAADTQISVFYRYAQVLGLDLQDLFRFNVPVENSGRIIPYDENAPERPKSCVPFYDIQVAAGNFSGEKLSRVEPSGWVKIENLRNASEYFVTHVSGRSMEPSIPHGSLCLFRLYQGGTRQNRIFLIKARGVLDPETQESFVVKKYRRITDAEEGQSRAKVIVHLLSENSAYPPIVLMASNENQIDILAELVEVLD